jgi:GNAT superfamily N-acetyltransferase
MYTVRLFEPTDAEYAAIVAVHDAAWPDERRIAPDRWAANDAEWTAEHLHQRFVVTLEGVIVAEGTCYEPHWNHQPGTIHLGFSVHPHHDGQGIDTLLLDAILAFVRQHRPATNTLATEMREDRAEQVAWLQARGFAPAMRAAKSALDVTAFDPAPYEHLEAQLASAGIVIITLAELQARAADWQQQLYELRWQLIQDVPSVEPPAKPTFEQFRQQVLEDPALDPEAWFLALDAGSGSPKPLIGMSNLWVNDPTYQRLDTGLTGVVSAYRRRGIATALKLRTIRYAQQHGACLIETSNEEYNPMYEINLQLGFRPRPASVSYRARWTPQ